MTEKSPHRCVDRAGQFSQPIRRLAVSDFTKRLSIQHPRFMDVPGLGEDMSYDEFLSRKSQIGYEFGFDPVWMPDFLYDFQSTLVEWVLRKGRGGIFADCGLGKTPMEFVWAENVARKTGKKVLILTALAVSFQMLQEAEKFEIELKASGDGTAHRLTVTNYEKLCKFDPADFAGCVCDESSILKSFDGTRRGEITAFMRKIPYRLLATATAAPNDFTELGTSSEALGFLGYMDMLNRFFKNDLNNSATGRMRGEVIKWRLKGHAEKSFWRWVCSWSRSIRKPSDLGFDDRAFILPELIERQHLVKASKPSQDLLFELPAIGLKEQREERKRTIKERCHQVADLVKNTGEPAMIWCNLNEEGNYLESIIQDAIQVSGKDNDDKKESKLVAFAKGNERVLITKPKIGAWGLNFQHCAHVLTFPTHSYEQHYQLIRRCYRFGQKKPVKVDIVLTEGDKEVIKNLSAKSSKADRMFESLVAEMNNALMIENQGDYTIPLKAPQWL